MKLNIKKPIRAEIMQLREQLNAALEEQNASSAEVSRLTDRREKLQSEITKLENAGDSDSDEASAKLSTKRVQLEQVEKKIGDLSTVSPAIEFSNQDKVLNLLRQFARAAIAATAPAIENYVQEITSKLRFYCSDDATARHLAFQTPAAKMLSQIYSRQFGRNGFSAAELKAAIARADEILSDDLTWNFDAKI
jgi:uncharacterized protein YdcH (DUF465 family)